MKTSPLLLSLLVAAAASAADPAPAPQLPTVQGEAALASVNGQPVSWAAFKAALASVHTDAEMGTRRAKQDPQGLLDRLITGKLITLEARNIGLDETPEFKAAVTVFRADTMEKLLLERTAASVTKSDPADVQRIYRAKVGLAKFDSVLFGTKAAADAFAASLAGKDFAATARAARDAGTAKSFDQGGGAKLGDLQPEIVATLMSLKPGQTTPPLPVKDGFTILKLEQLVVPDDAEAHAKAEEEALEWKRLQAVRRYTEGLRKRLVTLNDSTIRSLDFDGGKPELSAAKKDTRVVASIQGGKNVTVGELAAEVERNFFHGLEKAAKEKKINAKIYPALDEILVKRVSIAEGTRLGIDKTPAFRKEVAEYEDGLLFNAFLQKVVLPDIKVSDAEVRGWYDAHKSDYSSPGMLRLDSIAFTTRQDAEDAVKKVRSGSDFGWLKQNAPGRAPAAAGALQMTGVFVVDQMDAPIAKVLAGPKDGDARLYAPADGPVYVILIREVIPVKTQPFDEVRNDAGQAVVNDKMKATLDDWSAKLRKGYEVKTYVTKAQLEALIAKEFGRKA